MTILKILAAIFAGIVLAFWEARDANKEDQQ